MTNSVNQSGDVAPVTLDESSTIGDAAAEQIKDADLSDVNGGVSPSTLPYNPFPYVDPI